MPSLKDVKVKIEGVKKTKQITKAMNMVASAKLRTAQMRIERFRPYAEKFYEMLGDLAGRADAEAHPLLEVREEIAAVGIIVATSERGLCGSFNVNIIKAATRLASGKGRRRARPSRSTAWARRPATPSEKDGLRELAEARVAVLNSFDFSLANEIGLQVIEAYLAGELDEVHIILRRLREHGPAGPPVTKQLLPMTATKSEEPDVTGGASEYIYEPTVEGLLAELLPRFIKVQVYRGLLDTSASEHAARMTAMDNATKACDDMVDSLTLVYNKTRQTAITTELMDIVGGAEALKG